MVINSSDVTLKGHSDYLLDVARYKEAQRRLVNYDGTDIKPLDAPKAPEKDAADISDEAQKKLAASENPKKPVKLTETGDKTYTPAFSAKDDMKIELIRLFMESLSKDGRYKPLADAMKRRLDGLEGSGSKFAQPAANPLASVFANMKTPNISMPTGVYMVERSVAQREVFLSNSMSFSAQAKVTTADGRSIDVKLQFNMSQTYYEKTTAEFTQAYKKNDLKDPLVVNFNGTSAQLTERTFTFDLDADGKPDQISRLAPGSSFLALDRNGDGKINDGNELFGAKTGDGFGELAEFDSDRNGWIDEADPIFSKLRIWEVSADGTSKLIGLGEAGIGAIFLGHDVANYMLGSDLLNPSGRIGANGFFLFEDGRAGTIQNVDLRL